MDKFKYIFHNLRISHGLSQEQMAKELGISKSTIAMWETGKRLPSSEVFEQIADYFNLDIDYLYGRTNIKRKVPLDEYNKTFFNSEHSSIINYYNNLNEFGKQEATKRVEELTYIPKYTDTHVSVLNAAHEIANSSVADKLHDDDIMDNDEEWQ